MKPIAQAAASVLISITVSILATRLLRHMVFLTEGSGSEAGGEQHAPVIVVMPVVIGNTIGGPTILPRHGKLPALLTGPGKHR
jgi:hypothetical protein